MTHPLGQEIYAAGSMQPGRMAVGQLEYVLSCVRRLQTPRGTLRGGAQARVYGHDLRQYIGRRDPEQVRALLPDVIAAELAKDDRTLEVAATATISGRSAVRSIRVDIRARTSDGGTTSLTLDIDEVTVQLLGGV